MDHLARDHGYQAAPVQPVKPLVGPRPQSAVAAKVEAINHIAQTCARVIQPYQRAIEVVLNCSRYLRKPDVRSNPEIAVRRRQQ
jgi:uncharacterized metal-binding protein YceD (DUF177 family)